MKDSNQEPSHIVFYDGVCVLCNRFMQFLMRADKKGKMHFSTLQSDFANEALAEADFDHTELNTMVFKTNGRILTQSSAALSMYKMLGFPWSMMYVFIIVPPFIRNAVYKMVAKYRYAWFGKEDHCIIPDAHMRGKLID